MGDAVGLGLVERARDAAAREDWPQADDLAHGGGQGRPRCPTDLAVAR